MTAIERGRTAALGGHVARCEDCAHTAIAYNSCRNRRCPKCQGAAAKQWLAEREADLLPVAYFHVVFTLPAAIADIAYQNKAVIYDLLFKASAETVLTIAADPKHLGAHIGTTSVLHTWGSAMTHHPHPMCTWSCRVVVCRWMQPSGFRAGQTSSCPCACCRVCSGGYSSPCWWLPMKPAACSSSAIMLGSPTTPRSPSTWRHCAKPSGWYTPNSRSEVPSRCCDTCRAIPTASPSPIAG